MNDALVQPDQSLDQPLGALAAPAVYLETDSVGKPPADAIGICLSGGGYRAMLFHLGAIWRLCEVGALGRAHRVSSVSGGLDHRRSRGAHLEPHRAAGSGARPGP